MEAPSIELSIVLPIYNERENIRPLFVRLHSVLDAMGYDYEIVAVDDGSTDGSNDELRAIASEDPYTRVVFFRMNVGQTAALAAGIEHARGQIIVMIDSDLENDPADIPRLLEKLDEGYDVVSGWRKDRWSDAWITRRLPSTTANWLISRLSGVPLHDYGCTLKAYRADVIKNVRLYGEMHRFIPAYAAWQGGRVGEIPVSHTPRVYGTSKYGFGRMPRVLLDLVVIMFLRRYMNRPMHFFGGWGLLSLTGGFLAALAAVMLRVLGIKHFVETPLPILAALFIIVGIQFILFGVIAEILMRTYYESQDRRPYMIKEVIESE